MSDKAERRPGPSEIWLAVTKHDGVQVDSILIDQATFGQAVRQVRASHFDLPVALGLQLADRALQIVLNKPGVGADRFQRARDDPFRLVPPRRREGAFLCIPFRIIVAAVCDGDVAPINLLPNTGLPAWINEELNPRRTNKIMNLHQSVNRRVAGSNPARGANSSLVHSGQMGDRSFRRHG